MGRETRTFLIRIQCEGWDRDERGSCATVDVLLVHRPHGMKFSAERDEESRELLTVDGRRVHE